MRYDVFCSQKWMEAGQLVDRRQLPCEWSGVEWYRSRAGERRPSRRRLRIDPQRPDAPDTPHSFNNIYNNSTSVNNALSHHSRITYVPGFLTVHDTVGLSFAGGLTPGGGRLISWVSFRKAPLEKNWFWQMSLSRIKFAKFTSHKTLFSLLNTKLVRTISKVTTAVRLQMGSKVQIFVFDILHVRHERYFSQLIWRSRNSASQAKTIEFQMFDALILISGGRLYPHYSVIHIVFKHIY